MNLLDSSEIDPHFDSFYKYCQSAEPAIPITVLSAGITRYVERFLSHYELDILANDIVIHDDHWEIIYRDDSIYGHDKGLSIKLARAKHGIDVKVLFIGDGVSDIPAVKYADIIFAKEVSSVI